MFEIKLSFGHGGAKGMEVGMHMYIACLLAAAYGSSAKRKIVTARAVHVDCGLLQHARNP